MSGSNLRWLERESAEPTRLRIGALPISEFGWRYGYGVPLENMFDNETWSNTECLTHPNRVGVDLGGAYQIIQVDLLPRVNWTSRLNGADILLATEEEGANQGWTNCTRKVVRSIAVNREVMHSFRITDPNLYRYVMIYKEKDFCSNIAEMRVLGLTAEDVTAGETLLCAPDHPVLTSPADGMAQLNWQAGKNSSGYRVERKVDGGAWQIVEENLNALSYTDTS